MFTGIISSIGTLTDLEDGEILKAKIRCSYEYQEIAEGGSIAHDGICLTVINKMLEDNGISYQVEVSTETVSKTNIRHRKGGWVVGKEINLERSLRVGDELGGHILSGHVMSKARIIEKTDKGEGIDLTIESPIGTSPYILEKGFIAVDGMSLTVGEVMPASFSLHIIPETIRATTIGGKVAGDMVNIEIDSRTQAVVDTIRRMEVEG